MSFQGVKLWQKSDINGFFGLFTNNVANILVLTSLLLFVIEIPPEVVFGRILPGVGIAVFVSSLFYFYAAVKLAKKEGREDVTALPCGISVPHMFILTFAVMLPVRLTTGDPILAWHAGIAWCLLQATVEMLGAAFGNKIRKILPRAALLGSLAGISFAFIMTNSATQSWNMPIITIVCLGILLLGWVAKKKMPWGLPVGLVAIAIGTLIGWVTGSMDISAVADSLGNFGFHVPSISLFSAIPNFGVVLPFLLSAIPFGIYNFIETMDNVESAEAAGDSYNTTQIMVFDASTSFIGALFGNPVPTTVYIGHPGWKSVGARIGYGWGTGLGVFIIATTGLGAVLISIIPIAALLPILVYIGIVIGAQAFDAIPKRHMPAVVVAILPSLADWGRVLVGNAVGAAGGDPGAISLGDFANNGIHFAGMNTLADGAIIVGILWATITVFMIDRKDMQAVITIGVAAVLSFFGIIHSGAVGFGVGWQIAIGYLILGVIVFVLSKQGYIEEKANEE